MGLFSGITSAIGGITSTILGNNSVKHEAERNRDWQEDMSNTSVQRRIADLKAAGLNPLLAVSSASSGASTPSGGQANIEHFDPTTISTMLNGFASAKLVNEQAKGQELNNKNNSVVVDNMKANIEKTKADVRAQQINNEIEQRKLKIYDENPDFLKDEIISRFVDNPTAILNTSTGRKNVVNSIRSFIEPIGSSAKSLKSWYDKKKENYKRGFVPRDVNEKYISR